jgi:ABC-type amino acid transport substrate-binding protein
VRREDAQLLAALNDQLGDLRRSGAWSRLVVRYFGANALDLLKGARSE